MAEAQLSLSSFKKEFDDQLTCGVCLDLFTDPKMLPCGHIFCLKCIQQLPVQRKEGQYYISCPTCRVDHLTLQGGATNLPNAFHINSLLDLRKKLATSETFCRTLQTSKATTTCPGHKIIIGLCKPWGVAVRDNGDIVVAEWGAHCVTILNRNGTKVRSFGKRGTKEGQFTYPYGVAISVDGYILVTDEHRLQKLTTDGVCVKSVGSSRKGRGPLAYNYPTGIAVHPITGQIFVADRNNNRIQVFTTNLTFSHTITHEQLKWPYDVALDNERHLYATNCNNHCIAKFTSMGQYITTIAVIGTTPIIMHLTIYENRMYASEYGNNRVSIFDTNGQFLHSFGTRGSEDNKFHGPRGITTDSFGNLYVCDSLNNKIVIRVF